MIIQNPSYMVLFMARYTVCQPSNLILGLFQMTIQTPTHVHPQCWPGYRHLAYIAVASFTVDACSKVSLMAEVDEAGLLIYAIPGDWFASFPVAS